MAAERDPTNLLPSGALASVRVGVSVSDSPDLARLGLAEIHLRLALGEIARVVLLGDGCLVYGGHLDPQGYTAFLQSEIEKYGGPDEQLVVCLAWPVHRRLTLKALRAAEDDLGMRGHIVYLDPAGAPISRSEGRDEDPEPATDAETTVRALTALRHHLVTETDARVLVGGRRTGYQGAMPGVIEEAVIAIQAGQPLFLAAGFGGATWDAARVLGLTPGGWPDLAAGAPVAGLAELEEAVRMADGRVAPNGLTEEEDQRLAASHRASDVASLVAVGLGRLRSTGALGAGA